MTVLNYRINYPWLTKSETERLKYQWERLYSGIYVYIARTRGPWRRINFEKSEFPRIQTRKQL